MSVGGVAVFPADTVYGLACDVHNRVAVERLYALKRRRMDKPSAVMFFDLELALAALPELGERTRSALERLLPAAVTLLLPNPAGRFPLACGADGSTLGVRVPVLAGVAGVAGPGGVAGVAGVAGLAGLAGAGGVAGLAGLAGVKWPVLQSSANLAGGPDAVRLADVPEAIRRRADMVIDGGELPGVASTVVDLRRYEESGEWEIVREGAVGADQVSAALEWQFHFDPDTYPGMIRADIADYDRFQDELAQASGNGARRVLELGTGTGETARRLLERHPSAELVGIDENGAMLDAARAHLPSDRVTLRVSRLEDALPAGPFDLVATALCVHHLRGALKPDLFRRVRAALAPGGRFVLADLVVPVDPGNAVISVSPGFDHPSSLADQLRWLGEAGFDARVAWEHRDLAVVVADAPG
jgi:tRNA A37 threonylcarbamoyladenosine synthetase subunit TsaC/SUA5/YrdC